MEEHRMAVVGIGATGCVLAAALLGKYPETVLIGRKVEQGEILKKEGITVTGALTFKGAVKNFSSRIDALGYFDPTLIFLSTKTFHLKKVLDELETIYRPGMKIISMQNGLGPEDLVADRFGPEAVFRVSLNFGVSLKNPGVATAAFFNRPNHIGEFAQKNRGLGFQIAKMLTDCGLETEFVNDIRRYVWEKMIMKCTMASICAITNLTIKEALDFSPTREIANACFQEAMAVSKAVGYDLGEDYLKQTLEYLDKVGSHKDSMCHDIANNKPTEIDFLGGKIVDYARANGVPTPFYVAMTNLVKTFEEKYHGR